MNPDRFIQRRGPVWDELEALLSELERRGPRRTGPERVERLLQLYRQASADLAYLRTADAQESVLRRLNRLLVRTHGQLYAGRRRRRAAFRPLRFFLVDYPRLFRGAAGPMLASFLLCVGVYLLAYEAVQEQPALIVDIMGGPGAEQEFVGQKSPEDITERFDQAKQAMGSSVFSSVIMANNIYVALTAFALGMTAGLGTVYVLIVNAAMVGGIAGAFARSGIESTLWATLLPHGALELSAIVVAGGAGFVLGWSIWCPGDRTRRRALREESAKAVKLALGLVPAFVVAGFMEGFVTPSEQLPQWVKVALGVALAVVFWAWLLIGGRGVKRGDAVARAEEDEEVPAGAATAAAAV